MEIVILISILFITILIIKNNKKIMGTLENIQAEIQSLQTDLDAKQAAIETAFTNLQTAITNGNSDPALQQVLTDLQAVRADVNSTVVPETSVPTQE